MVFLAVARNIVRSLRPSSRHCRGACLAKSALDVSAPGPVRSSLEDVTLLQQAPRADTEVRRTLLALGACIGASPLVSWSLCESGEGGRQADTATTDDEEDEEFDFNFAKPPVAPAPLELRFAVQVKPGAAGQRPMSDILVQSVFSLPVERGWPRDKLSPAEVAESMAGVLADRLPRFAADYWDLRLTGAPLQLRGGIDHWPAAGDQKPAELRSDYLPEPFPPIVSLRRLAGSEVGFTLNSVTTLTVSCTSLGVRNVDAEERLDLELTTRLQDFPVAGWAWGFVGCGGRWWFEKYRLPVLRRLLEAYHQMAHEQMMLFYVAALRD